MWLFGTMQHEGPGGDLVPRGTPGSSSTAVDVLRGHLIQPLVSGQGFSSPRS